LLYKNLKKIKQVTSHSKTTSTQNDFTCHEKSKLVTCLLKIIFKNERNKIFNFEND